MRPLSFFAILCSATFVPLDVLAQEWSRFRGPNGSGVSSATTVPTRWTEEDYNWRVDLPGVGHSSPVLWGQKLFVTWGDEDNGSRVVACYDASSGEQKWTRTFPATTHRKHKLNSFASPTPVVDADQVYIAWGTPDEIVLLALTHDGQSVWRRNLGKFRAGHGFGVSPILYADTLVLPIEHQDSVWTALDKNTGQDRWRVARNSKLHYATPCIFSSPGQREELIFTNWEHGICGADPANGTINWSLNVFDKGHIESSIASPIVVGDLVIGVCGYLGYGYETVAVRPPSGDRAGENIAEQDSVVWRITRGAPLCPTPVAKDNLLFLWSDGGIVTCVEVSSGKVHWQKRVGSNYYSSPVCVADHLYNLSVDGDCVVIKASADYELVARNDLGEGSHSTPAVANGTMYLRTFTQLMSLGGPTD